MAKGLMKIKVPVRVKAPRVRVKKVHVKAPHITYKTPASTMLGLHESSDHPLMRRR